MKIKIYSGLSLNEQKVKEIIPHAEFSPPVKRGDLLKDIRAGVQLIGIIDGEFLQNLAVSPSEIKDCLRCGVKVYGASSMGALRAAELSKYGMIGHGRIYEHILKTPYFKDDHLGQISYGNDSHLISPSMMDVIMGVMDLKKSGRLNARDALWITRTYEGIHFSERNISALKAKVKSLPRVRSAALMKTVDFMTSKIQRAKQADGIELLRRIQADLENVKILNDFLRDTSSIKKPKLKKLEGMK